MRRVREVLAGALVVGGIAGCGDGGDAAGGADGALARVEKELVELGGPVKQPARFRLECHAAALLFDLGRGEEAAARYRTACSEACEIGDESYSYRDSLTVLNAAAGSRADGELVRALAYLAAFVHPKKSPEFRAMGDRYRERVVTRVSAEGTTIIGGGEARDWPDAWLFPDERPMIWEEVPGGE